MKNWLARKRYVTKLCMEIADLHDRMQRRSQLIADQDAEITSLRVELKSQTDLANELSQRLALAHEKQRDAETAAEYWQGKAANP